MAPATPYETILLNNILSQLQDLNHSIGALNSDVATIKAEQASIKAQMLTLSGRPSATATTELGKYVGLAKYIVPILLALFLAVTQSIAPTPDKTGLMVDRKRIVTALTTTPVPAPKANP